MDTVAGPGYGQKAVLLENFLDFPAETASPQSSRKEEKRVAPRRRKGSRLHRQLRALPGDSASPQGRSESRGHGAIFSWSEGPGGRSLEMKALAARTRDLGQGRLR